MVERRQDLALHPEAHHVNVGIESGAQELERHLLLELAVRTLGEEDARHAATSDFPNESVGTDAPAFPPWSHGRCVRQGCEGWRHDAFRQIVEVWGSGFVRVEKRSELST